MTHCACGARLAPHGVDVPVGTTACAACAAETPVPTTVAATQSSVVTGALAGLLAAVAAAAAWFAVVAVTGYQVGLIAVAVGWLVAQAVVLGGRGRGGAFQALSVALTLASMAAAEYLVTWHFTREYFAAEGLGSIPLVLPAADAVAVIGESLAADPLTLVFWLVALVTAWRGAAAPKED